MSHPAPVHLPTLERVLAILENPNASKQKGHHPRSSNSAAPHGRGHSQSARFPGLNDADWHYADGQLAGMQTAVFAIRALRQDASDKADQPMAKKNRPSLETQG
jgi:hypothetical protein